MTATLTAFVCGACDASVPTAAATRCPECGGSLYAQYDWSVDGGNGPPFRDRDDIWRYDAVLPFAVDEPPGPITMGEGWTPLVQCPGLAETTGVADLTIQDDGRSTTGAGLADRGASVVATAARAEGAEELVLASTGASAVALAAYAARGIRGESLDTPGGTGMVHAFVPARSPFAHKALYNVHGGDMRVVGGRYDDAVADLREARADETDPAAEWTPVGPEALPHWVEGAKTAALEAWERCDGLPDAVVCPAGHGVALAGWWRGLAALEDAGYVETPPRLCGVQAGGCAPIVEAAAAGETDTTAVETPDTVSGALEVPDPAVGDLALRAVEETGGGAVAVSDEALLEAGVQVSRTAGLGVGTPGAAAVAGVARLVETGVLGAEDRILVYNPTAATPEADLFRSHLMRRGE